MQFLEQNPSLEKHVNSELGTLEDGNYVFGLEDLSGYELVVDYIAALIELVASICLSRNNNAINLIINNFEFSFKRILDLITNVRIHSKIRRYLLFLIRVLFVDVDPYLRYSEFSNRCYYWDAEHNTFNNDELWPKSKLLTIYRMETLVVPVNSLV